MVRRVALTGLVAAFLLGVFSSEATAGVTHHSTEIIISPSVSISNGEMVVRGTLDSDHRRCEKRRRVGLFPAGNQSSPLDVTKSNRRGRFVLRGPAQSGSYDIIAYTQNGACLHVCDMAVERFSF